MVGSYILIRGVSFYFGGYPNEFEVAEELKTGALDKIPNSFYVYVGFMLLFLGFGVYHQRRKWK